MVIPTKMRTVATCAFLLVVGLDHAAIGQEWPTKPVRIIEPYPAGFARDPRTRFIAEKLSGILRQQVYVENRPGAAGRIAGQTAVFAAPDGYTFNMMGIADLLAKHLYNLPYDMERDLVPVTMIATQPGGVIVRSSLPVKDILDLIKDVKERPGAMTYGSTGAGSFIHVNALLFSSLTNTKLTHVPYGQGNPLTDLVGGHIDIVFDSVGPLYLANIKAGKLRALAVTGERRVTVLPDIPTFIEGGLPTYDPYVLYGLFAPKGTPDLIVTKMQTAISQLLQEPELRRQWANEAATPVGSTSAEFAARLRSESERWGKVIRANNIKLE